MAHKFWLGITIAALLLILIVPGFAQETTVKGNLAGSVVDATGAVIPGAKVTATGPIGVKTTETDQAGDFEFPLLTLGMYSVRIEKEGFKGYDVKGVEVVTGKTTTIRITLQPGIVSETVEVSATAVMVDVTSTAVSASLPDTLYTQIPMSRGVAGIFYMSPGVSSGGGTGDQNPSISGGSGLENQYIADGVNITDTSFGGLGVFNRVFGSVGTGINLSFVKEVQVKTGGFEAQYGKSTGGIVQIVTKSGSNEYHGALSGFFAPQQFEATRLQPDNAHLTNFMRQRFHVEGYDVAGEFGGYVPKFKDKLFFFGSVNPTWNRNFDQAWHLFGLSSMGTITQRTNAFNYSAKLTWKISDKHTLESSIFGDPAHTGTGPWINGTTQMDNISGFTKQDYGTRNWVARYNATLSPTWLFNASFNWAYTRFHQTFPNVVNGIGNYQLTDQTQTYGLPGQRGNFRWLGVGFYENTNADNYGMSLDTTKIVRAGASGEHSFNLGYRLEKPDYNPYKNRSGPMFPIPATNMLGQNYLNPSVQSYAPGTLTNASFQVRLATDPHYGTMGIPGLAALAGNQCTLCPFMQVPGIPGWGPGGSVPVYLRNDRGEFGPTTIQTSATYHAAYATDTWTINKHVTATLGLRWEQQQMRGDTLKYTFTDNWSPRVGISVDPVGDRKTKIYANFGRYNYVIPLDMAERSLSNELDFTSARWAPAFTTDASGNRIVTINSLNSPTPVLDAAHVLSRANTTAANFVDGFCINPLGCGTGSYPGTSSQGSFSGTGIAKGTKMQYVNEFVVGGEREIWGGVILSVRYIDRRMPRIVEDASGIAPEAYNAGLNQIYLITNPGRTLDLFTNPIGHTYTSGATPPLACGGADAEYVQDPVTDTYNNNLGAVCYEPTGVNGELPGSDIPDGVADGFPQPIRNYQAVEIEFNKPFSRNWQMRVNWRIAKLWGNYEGAFRNDNGQTDPSISSLYDFVAGQFGLLGDQFKAGWLNTDRRHVVNGYLSYVFDKTALKGLTLGVGARVESGWPYNDLKAHPAYLNSGEIPVGGRGALGRSLADGQVDFHADYVHSVTEKTRLRFGVDMFNITNMQHLMMINQNEDVTFGTPDLDFQKPVINFAPAAYQRPFYGRLMVRFEF